MEPSTTTVDWINAPTPVCSLIATIHGESSEPWDNNEVYVPVPNPDPDIAGVGMS